MGIKNETSWTPLMRSAASGHTQKVLIHKNADLDAMDKKGRTALSRAADNGSDDIVRELYLAEADPSQRTSLKLVTARQSCL